MNKDECLKLIREAKHSTGLLLSLLGSHPSIAHVVIKWPDVVDAYVAEDEEAFKRDVGVLMCHPIRLIADTLAEKVGDKKALELTQQIMKWNVEDNPVKAKSTLIGICNNMIRQMPVSHRIPAIKELP